MGGIDYGMGLTNIDLKTGIRFGVIPASDVVQAWADSAEGDYGPPTCPKCGREIAHCGPSSDNYHCPDCKTYPEPDEIYGDEALAWTLNDGEYKAEQGGDDHDIFITLSPYYTFGPFCSPCAPGAVYLRDADDDSKGQMAYCFTPDWFDYWKNDCGCPELTGEFEGDKTSCPYPVYRVKDDECIFMPNPKEAK